MALPPTMQAWKVKLGNREPIRTSVPVPEPALESLLVKVLAMGVCHSDCSILALDEPIFGMRREFILGHECAGEIVKLGSEVDGSQFALGDKVAMHIVPGCEKSGCPDCSRGFQRICRRPGSGNYGLGFADGFFAEYVAVQSRATVKVPNGVSMLAAAVAPDAVLTAYQAVKYTGNVKPEHTIAIYGLGGLGLNALQIAQHIGVKRILVVDKRQETLDEAIKLGVAPEDAFCTGDSGAPSIEAVVSEKGIQIDTCLDFVGHESTVLSAQYAVRSGGHIVLTGLISQQAPLMVGLSVMKAISIDCNYGGTIESLGECLDLIAKGVIQPRIETGSVEDLPKVLRDLDEGKVKSRMVLLPDWKKSVYKAH